MKDAIYHVPSPFVGHFLQGDLRYTGLSRRSVDDFSVHESIAQSLRHLGGDLGAVAAQLPGDRDDSHAASRLLPGVPVMRLSEDHTSLRGLQDLGYRDVNRLVEVPPSILHHHHGAVIQITYALVGLGALLDDAHFQRLSVEDRGLHRIGQLVDVQHTDAL